MQINWNKLFNLLIGKWKVFVVLFIVLLTVSVIADFTKDYFFVRDKVARATLLLIKPRGDGLSQEIDKFIGGGYMSRGEAGVIGAIMDSNALAKEAVLEVNLDLPYWQQEIEKMREKGVSVEVNAPGLKVEESALGDFVAGRIRGAINSGGKRGSESNDVFNLFGQTSNSQIFVISAAMPDYAVAADVVNSYVKALARFLNNKSLGMSFIILDPPTEAGRASGRKIGWRYFYNKINKKMPPSLVGAFLLCIVWILFLEWRKDKLVSFKRDILGQKADRF